MIEDNVLIQDQLKLGLRDTPHPPHGDGDSFHTEKNEECNPA